MAGRTRLAALVLAAAFLGLGAILFLARDPEAQRVEIGPAAADSVAAASREAIQQPQQLDATEVRAVVPGRADPAALEPAPKSVAVPSRWMRARIVDELGVPLPGATMSFEDRGSLATTSGPDGSAALAIPLDQLGPETSIVLDFKAEGRTSERRWVDLRPEGDCHAGEVALLPAGSIVGRIAVANGSPSGILVGAFNPLAPLSEQDREKVEMLGWGLFSRGSARSKADGSYRIDRVAVGPCIVAARQPGSFYAWSEPFTVQAGQVADAGTIVLREPSPDQCIEGVVLDSEGKPCGSRVVQLWKPGIARNGDPQLQSMNTDPEGHFRLAVQRSSVVHVILLDEQQQEEIARVENVAPGGPSIELRVPPERFLEVFLSSERGEPVEDAWMYAFGADHFGIHVRPEKVGLGTWRIGLPARSFCLVVNARGHEYQKTQLLDPATVPERIELTLQPARGAHLVCAVKRNGDPVTDARIVAYELLEGPHRLNTGFTTRLESEAVADGSASGEPGVYELRIKREATIVLLVLVQGRVVLEHGPILVGADDPERRIDFTLPSPGTIEGRVLLVECRDPAGIVVGASRGDGEVRAVTLGTEPEFRLEGLAPGNWQVRPLTKLDNPHLLNDRRSYADEKTPTWDLVLEAGETARFDLDLRHQSLHRIRGRVRLTPDGPSAWRFRFRAEDGEVASDGTFHADTFEPGTTHLTLWAYYGPSWSLAIHEQLDLRPGETPWVLDLLTGELELTGVPAFEAQNARGGQQSELLRLQWTGDGSRKGTLRISSHSGGPLLLRGLPPGNWAVETRLREDGSADRDWHRHPAEIILAPGDRQEIQL